MVRDTFSLLIYFIIKENIACQIFKQILIGIQYLHVNGVCHRDIKLENILSSRGSIFLRKKHNLCPPFLDGTTVKILDFDVSKFKKEGKYSGLTMNNMKMWTYTGTLSFIAPEVLDDLEYT